MKYALALVLGRSSLTIERPGKLNILFPHSHHICIGDIISVFAKRGRIIHDTSFLKETKAIVLGVSLKVSLQHGYSF